MFLLNGHPLQLDTPFSHNGIQYPANWLRLSTLAEKEAIGITEVAEQSRPDDRFYWVTDNNDGTYSSIAKTLHADANTGSGLINQWTQQVQQTAYTLLSPSDWQVIRKMERNIDIDANTASYRANVIFECTRLVQELANTANIDGLITIVTTQNWPEVK